ncbi:hypothetical protein BGZ95_004073 [Linnemannia exigua]|uniref:Uncharacterized protein n=1 Tax=Linnemannia exigua TaxID=604196 RepID=A0AAD4D3F1_9FUNG|nr:hypothetical protein BGZ95_004073 [Linnemannia exigua]
MSNTIPLYLKPCLVPSSSNTIYLVGIASSREGILEANSIELTNINTPTIKQIASQVNAIAWSSSQPLACHPYAGLGTSTTYSNGSPFLVAQFGAFKTFFANVNPAGGTIEQPTRFAEVAFTSPRNFALTGASAGGSDWVLALTNTTVEGTGSYWSGIRFNGTAAVASNYNFGMSVALSANPLLTVGTYSVDSTLGLGYITMFDYVGGGVSYTTMGTMSDINTPKDRIINLSNPHAVTMNGITLTTNAIPVTAGETAFILDQGSDGSTVVYYIKPSTSSQLTPLLIKGQVPKFSNLLSATALNAQIVIYSGSIGSPPSFNSLDTTTGTWTGPGLVAPNLPSTSGASLPSSSNGANGGGGEAKSNVAAIIGGAVGGLVVIALVAFLFIRNRRKKNTVPVIQKPVDSDSYQNPNQIGSSSSQMHQPFPQQQQQLYQQQYQQQQQYQLQQCSQNAQPSPYDSNHGAYSGHIYSPIQEQEQRQPQLFIGQQQHVYTPPTLISHSQPSPSLHPSPVIFQVHSPLSQSMGSPANSHSHTVSSTGAEYPTSPTSMTPMTSHIHLHSSALNLDDIQELYKPPPSNPQYIPGPSDK